MMDVDSSEIRKAIDADLGAHFFPTKESRDCPSCNENTLALNFGKFGAYVACRNYPDCKFSKQLEAPNEDTGNTYPKLLGQLDGLDLHLKKGPYGFLY